MTTETESIIETPAAAADAPAAETVAAEAVATETVATEAAATDTPNTEEPGEPGGEASDGESVIATASESGKEEAVSFEGIKTPQGVEMDAEYIENMTPFFKDMGFDAASAQKYVDHMAELETQGQTDQLERFAKLKTEWVKAAEADTEIGGDQFTKSVQSADAAVNKFGTPEFKKVLKDYGLGNHPEIIRTFARIGKLMKEDSPGNLGDVAPAASILDTADIMYPDEKQSIN